MKIKRIEEIEEYIQEKKSVTLDELCQYFHVSINTIRRDIVILEEKGTIKKVYGGVVAVESDYLSFEMRDVKYDLEKKQICEFAAQFIEKDDVIFVDSGTTTQYICQHIPMDKPITLVTNNLGIIQSAVQSSHIELMLLGTTFQRKTNSFIYIPFWDYYDKINISKAFMSATGVSMQQGATNSDIHEYEIKKYMIEKAKQKILLVDHSKFDKSTLMSYATLEQMNSIVTDDCPSAYDSFCKENSIHLYCTGKNK